jgi:hypothetical protein
VGRRLPRGGRVGGRVRVVHQGMILAQVRIRRNATTGAARRTPTEMSNVEKGHISVRSFRMWLCCHFLPPHGP